MGDYNELVSICKHLLFERFAPAPAYIRGLLGDGQGNVLVPDRPDYNYARFNRSSTDVFEIFNKEVSQPIDNLPILIGEYPWQPGLTQVVGIDWATYNQIGWGNTYANLQAHASTHEWPDLSPGSDYTRTFLRSIVPLQGYGAGSGTSYNFYAQPYEYDYTGTSQYWPGLPPISLAGALPATGTMRYMGVYLNPATNQLGAVSGSAVAYVDNSEPPRPKFPLNVYPVAYARLYGGQQFIAERDTRDARRLWNNTLIFTGTSGGGGAWPLPHVLTVSPTGNYPTIQAAHDAASAGDVIWPDPGTYAESLTFTKDIILFAPGVTVTGSVSISAAATVIYLTVTETAANARGFVCSGGVEMTLLDCTAIPNGSATSYAIEATGVDTILNVRGGYYDKLGAGSRLSISTDASVRMDDPIIVNPAFVETGGLKGQYLDQGGNVYIHGIQYFDNLSSMSSGVWLESSGSTRLRTHYFVSGDPSAALLLAIAALVDGDTITCSNGSYSIEAVITANDITIEGVGRVTITSAVDDTITLDITGNNCTLRNLIIEHTGAGSIGFAVSFDGDNLTFENCTVRKSGAPSLGAALYQYGGTGAKAFNTLVTESGATNGFGYYNTIAAGDIEFYGGKISGTDYDIWGDVSGSTLTVYDTVLAHQTSAWDGDVNGQLFNGKLVTNSSGASAPGRDVGYIDANGDYKTTTTANAFTGSNCVVILGGGSTKKCFVATKGRWDMRYIGSAPADGDFLVTTTTAGAAGLQATMRPEIFARCQAAGASNVVTALLLNGAEFISYDNADLLIGVDSASSSSFTALINAGGSGGLTATNVPYDTISVGAVNSIVPLNVSAGDLAKQRLYNSTRGTYRLITAVNTGSAFITTVSSTDTWADNDAITIQSQTCSTGGTPFMVDLDLSQQTGIPPMTRAILIGTDKKDTTSVGQYVAVHPWVAFAASKEKRADNANTTQFSFDHGIAIGLIQQRFCWRFLAGGAGSSSNRLRIEGYWLAVP